MAWIDLLRQLGNFNWGPGWCNNIVTKDQPAKWGIDSMQTIILIHF